MCIQIIKEMRDLVPNFCKKVNDGKMHIGMRFSLSVRFVQACMYSLDLTHAGAMNRIDGLNPCKRKSETIDSGIGFVAPVGSMVLGLIVTSETGMAERVVSIWIHS